ncbi:family 78 glycoside hydrolase catalytic domain [Amnibacterium sp.]|uniref:family 78 glycoside hydrolase catalytic domain n=1 Tax=Amnibacterium sp. TaxID=1872496 RepID=UPI003F7BF8B9
MSHPTSPRIDAPRFEHHREALGIGERAPRLSWIVRDAPNGWRGRAFVAVQRDGTGTTTRVELAGSESVLVDWPFPPLASRERREVRIEVRGEDGTTTASPWASVEAGLLDAGEWTAVMVGPEDGTDAAAARSPLLRTGFDLPAGEVVQARLYATAHGLVEPWINGTRVGDHELTPGWTAYEARLRYATFDVTPLVAPGANVLGAWLGDGWWRGRLGWDGRRDIYGSDLGVLAQLEVRYADGSVVTVASSTDWTAAPSAIEASDIYDGETFDATRYDPSWSTAGFDAATWTSTAVRTRELATLVAPDGPPVRHVETLAVRDVQRSPSGALVLDFGQNLVGRLRIRVRGAEGDVVTLRHAEVLEHGELATEPLRTAKATDIYRLSGAAEGEEWAPRFTFHGFRYASVEGWPGEFDPASVVAEVLHSDLERTGTFSSSDPRVDRLHENVVWGMRGNFVDVPTDCPQRDERLGWTGDLQVFAPTASFLYASGGFLASWMQDLAAEQRRLDGVPMVVPAVTMGAAIPTAGWSDAATVVPWTVYERTGDTGILRRQYRSMVDWVDQVAALAGDDHLWNTGYQFGDWLDPTAPPERPDAAKTYPEIVATAYFARSSRIVADTAAVLGEHADAERYTALADAVREAFRREYVTATGRLLSDSATAYAIALQFDLLEGDLERAGAAKRLAELVRDTGYTIPTGFLGTPVIMDALTATGHVETAYRLLLQEKAPSWLYEVKQGATTIWERWDSLLPDGTVNPSGMTSFNHYAFGAVADWLHRTVAGIAPAAPGYRRIRFAPVPPRRGLVEAASNLATPYGDAAVEWRLADGSIELAVTVPVGATGEVVLPSGALHADLAAGVHRFEEPFEVDAVTRLEVTVDTPLGTLIEDDAAMAVLMGVVTKYVPEAAEQMSGGLRGQDSVTPRQIAGMLPHTEEVLHDLERGFAAVSAGEPVPEDVTTREEAAVDDALADGAALLTGADFWSTRAVAGVRSLVLTDGPHGVRRQDQASDHLGINDSLPATCFPTASAIASSWDPELVEEVGVALGREARSHGVDVLLGPGVNIKRSPLGGRNFEYFSEDPRVAGELGAAWVRGVQSTGVGASLKHFAVNNQETDRMRVDAQVDERTLRELYLPAFEHVVTTASPATVMSAYNAVNGLFCSESRPLLTGLLREEWGFDGVVVSDWGAIKDRVEALAAGLDLEMPGPSETSTATILSAVRDRRIDGVAVEAAAARIRRLAERTRPAGPAALIDVDAHHALARRAAARSIVLLRNERGTLPLQREPRVAVLGALAVDPQFQGGGSSHVNATRVDEPLAELRQQLGADRVTYAPGYARAADADQDALRAQAVEVAQEADIAVVFVGLYESEQSEGFDRTDLELPAAHVALISAVADVAPRTVVVLQNGGVVSLEPWHDRVDAILEGFALGQAAGGAIADVLTGRSNPSGRLAETIPMRLADTPSYLTFPGENEIARYAEGLFVGYRYYSTVDREVRYPFGHGLSYTSFAVSDPAVTATGPDTVHVRLEVTNTGAVAGTEVVQLYVSPRNAPVRRPVRELRAFRVLHLEAGESQQIDVELERRAFAFWDVAKQRWKVAAGEYVVEVGRSAADIAASAAVVLEGDSERPDPLTLDSTVQQWFDHPAVGPALLEGMLQGASPEQRADMESNLDALKMIGSMPMAQFARMPMVGIPDEALEQLIGLSEAAAAGMLSKQFGA